MTNWPRRATDGLVSVAHATTPPATAGAPEPPLVGIAGHGRALSDETVRGDTAFAARRRAPLAPKSWPLVTGRAPLTTRQPSALLGSLASRVDRSEEDR